MEIQEGLERTLQFENPCGNKLHCNTGDRTETITVPFPQEFSQVPKVILAIKTLDWLHTSGNGGFDLILESVTKSDYTYTAKSLLDGRLSSFHIYWMALVDRDTRISYKEVNTPNLDVNDPTRTTDLIETFDVLYDSPLVCTSGIKARAYIQGGSYIGQDAEFRVRIKDTTNSNKVIVEAIASKAQVKKIRVGIIATCSDNIETFEAGTFFSVGDNAIWQDPTPQTKQLSFDYTPANVNFETEGVYFVGASQFYSPNQHTNGLRFGGLRDNNLSDGKIDIRITTWSVSLLNGGICEGFIIYPYDCIHGCKNCDSRNTCNTCVAGSGRVGSDCQCSPGKFQDSGNVNCSDCDDKCGTCETNSSNCMSCKYSDPFLLTFPDCVCKPGYLENGSHGCDKCDDKCVDTCTGSTTNCDQCKATFIKIGNACVSCNSPCETCSGDQDTCVDCIFGHYKDGSTCTPCPHPYVQCSNVITPTECKSGLGRLLLGDKCVCDVNNGYFEKNTDDCGECVYPCLTCSGTSSSCDTCVSSNRKSDGTCDCELGFYEESQLCSQCPLKFKECSDQDTPTLCHSDAIGRSTSIPCYCHDKFFQVGTEKNCSECLAGCATCSDGNSCDTCVDPSKNASLQCTCPSIFFLDSNGVCQSCLPECKSCSNSTTCDSCLDSTKSILFKCKDSCDLPCTSCDDNKVCQICQFGYVLINQVCEKCHSRCLTCSESDPNTCIICKPGLENRNKGENCECEEGFFENETNQKCQQCKTSNCRKCDQNGDCLECRNEKLLAPECKNEKKGNIIVSEVIDGQTVIIKEKCSPKCEQCSSDFDICDSCTYGIQRQIVPPCLCNVGYHDDNGLSLDCQMCPNGCRTCLSSQKCVECKENQNRKLDSYTNLCECIPGYKEDSTKHKCLRCYQYNDNCLLECPQNTFQNKQSFICQEKEYELDQNILLIWISAIVCLFTILISYIFLYLSGKKYTNTKQKRNIIQQ